ncbi:diaminopropionate ammonia-lyase [Brachyspira alvinipulli]|uniref:diaminopropionate ammonia-lyase n=1 Tax=Brachyspira alvinipulli TaxID=84379 RepID=UPI0004B6BB23|nr:diaminopropionate ammonia-lyase [Brachyspira alvinipulli]
MKKEILGCCFFNSNCIGKTDCDLFNLEIASESLNYLKTVKEYNETPLVELKNLAKKMKVKKVFVKDESYRMGLNSFKAVGVIYGVSKVLCKILGVSIKDISFNYFLNANVQDKIKDIVFSSVTDGNHGRGLAYTAKLLGCKCIIYVPKQTSKSRINAIRDLGADVIVSEYNYDDTLKLVIEKSKEMGWYHIQDQAWDGYIDTANYISQGYTAIAEEIKNKMLDIKPTHIILQAGAGTFALGIMAYYTNLFKDNKPHMTIIEADTAGCYMKSAVNNCFSTVGGDLNTIMAGLSVGEPNIFAYNVLKDIVDYYITCPDEYSALGMRILGNPIKNDARIISGESGAVCLGIAYCICVNKNFESIRKEMNITEDSILLFISTEGDTDRKMYEDILWYGKKSMNYFD